MTAVLKEQNISRLAAMSKFVSFEIIYWKESYSTVLQEIGWLSFLHILDSFIRSRVVLGDSIGYAVTCKIRETFRNGSETIQI